MSERPTLFLDVDGVLNTRPGSLDEDKLELLDKLVHYTNAQVVLSTSWRKYERMNRLIHKVLAERFIEVIGFTPVLEEQFGAVWGGMARWDEISQWLSKNPHGPYVILDDQPMGPLSNRLIQTESHIGLTQELANLAIQMLSGPEEFQWAVDHTTKQKV